MNYTRHAIHLNSTLIVVCNFTFVSKYFITGIQKCKLPIRTSIPLKENNDDHECKLVLSPKNWHFIGHQVEGHRDV